MNLPVEYCSLKFILSHCLRDALGLYHSFETPPVPRMLASDVWKKTRGGTPKGDIRDIGDRSRRHLDS